MVILTKAAKSVEAYLQRVCMFICDNSIHKNPDIEWTCWSPWSAHRNTVPIYATSRRGKE